MILPRTIEETFRRVSSTFPVTMVTGPRQAGKTTLLRKLSEPDRRFVSLDDLDARRLAQEDPRLFLSTYPPPVTIDEFQYAPDLTVYIKIAVDELTTRGKNKAAAGMFWLTGSQQFALMKNIRESMAGRVAILELLGMDPTEAAALPAGSKSFFQCDPTELQPWAESPSPQSIFSRIIDGSMPALLTAPRDEETRRRFYSSYVQTYLERDVSALDGVRNLREFELFFRLLAARAGQLINYSELAKEVGVSAVTIRSWTEILTRSFHIATVGPYFRSLSKRLVKTPKIYFLDSGLQAWLTGWQDPETALRGPLAGQMLENWVVGLLIRSAWHRGREHRLWFWRTSTGQEVDLMHDDGEGINLAEIKLGASKADQVAHRAFGRVTTLDPHPQRWNRRYVLNLGPNVLPLESDTWQVPVWYIR
jgi:predicted AAA+ superfamily ATPase